MTKEQLVVELEALAEKLSAIATQIDGDLTISINAATSGYMDVGCYVFGEDKVTAVPIRRYHCSYEGATWEADREDACAEIN